MASSIHGVPYASPQHVYLHWSQVLRSKHWPWGRSIGVLLHLLSIVLSLSFFLPLSVLFWDGNSSGQLFFCGSRFSDPLSFTSSVLTHIPLYSLSSHSKWSANVCAVAVKMWPREKRVLKSCICPSFLFLGPVRGEKRRLFYFQQPKRKSALLETCLFMEMVEGWERKRSGESSGKIWSPCRGEVWYLFRWGWVKYGL